MSSWMFAHKCGIWPSNGLRPLSEVQLALGPLPYCCSERWRLLKLSIAPSILAAFHFSFGFQVSFQPALLSSSAFSGRCLWCGAFGRQTLSFFFGKLFCKWPHALLDCQDWTCGRNPVCTTSAGMDRTRQYRFDFICSLIWCSSPLYHSGNRL